MTFLRTKKSKVKSVGRKIGQAKNRIKKTDRTNIITTNFVWEQLNKQTNDEKTLVIFLKKIISVVAAKTNQLLGLGIVSKNWCYVALKNSYHLSQIPPFARIKLSKRVTKKLLAKQKKDKHLTGQSAFWKQ